MRLAYFSPLPPSKSGIADYSAELLPYLARGAEITVFVEQPSELRQNQGRADYAVQQAIYFDEIHEQHPFDLCLYHQGNNPYHEYIYERALKTPGLLVLHEHCLHHLIAWKTLGRNDEEGYWREMFHAYGQRGARMAETRARAVFSEYQQFLMPLNQRVVNRSLGIVVHNAYAVSQLEELNPGIPVEIVPHHLSPAVYDLDNWDRNECRRSLGLPENAFIISSHGFVTESKRIPKVLGAFQRLLTLMPSARYLIVGEDHWRWKVAPLIERMGLRNHVRITGYVTEKDFFRYLKAVDVTVNLRYPTAGETSGTLIRSLGAGKPSIVSDFGQFSDLPDDVCLKVAPGPNEERELAARLQALAYRPTLREHLSQRAARWIREECAIERSAAHYLAFAEQLIKGRSAASNVQTDYQIDFPPEPAISFDHREAMDYLAGFFADDPNATSYLRKHGQRILETMALTPVGDPSRRVLELSSYLQMPALLHRYGNYGEILVTNLWEGVEGVEGEEGEPREKPMHLRHATTGEELDFRMHNVDVERDRLPWEDQSIDVALCCELIEHLREDPMHMLIELHRVLKWGGLLILTTPNIACAQSVEDLLAGRSPYIYGLYNRQSPADRHAREYTPEDVRAALLAAGFEVVKLTTKDIWHETNEKLLADLDRTGVPREWRGDNIFAVGRKLSRQVTRYPEELYE